MAQGNFYKNGLKGTTGNSANFDINKLRREIGQTQQEEYDEPSEPSSQTAQPTNPQDEFDPANQFNQLGMPPQEQPKNEENQQEDSQNGQEDQSGGAQGGSDDKGLVEKKIDEAKDKIKSKAKTAVKNKINAMPLSLKLKILAIGFGIVLLIILVSAMASMFANSTIGTLLLTGKDGDSSTNQNEVISENWTEEEVAKDMIVIGDSRINGINNLTVGTKYMLSSGNEVSWLNNNKTEIQSTLDEGVIKFVVFAPGVNGVRDNTAEDYISIYNSYINKYKDKDIEFYVLSVNPINEEKAGESYSGVTNSDIQAFNAKMKSTFGDKRYIDTYSLLQNSTNVTDGVSYTQENLKTIKTKIMQFVIGNTEISKGSIGFLDSYPLNAPGAKPLQTQITTLFGDAWVNNLSSLISKSVQSAGKCSKKAAAAAGVTLAYNIYKEGYKVPYYWGGGHSGVTIGVPKNLGQKTAGSSSPARTYYYYGFDCSGFVIWAFANAYGNSNFFFTIPEAHTKPNKSFSQIETGDILTMVTSSGNHVILVIENKGNKLVTLESAGGDNGLVFREYGPDILNKYHAIDLAAYKGAGICGI